MVTLSQIENKDLQELVRSINVSPKARLDRPRTSGGAAHQENEHEVQDGHSGKRRSEGQSRVGTVT